MKTFKTINKAFNFKTTAFNGWTAATNTTFAVKLCTWMVYMDVLGGRDPFVEEVFYAISTLLKKRDVPIDRDNYPGYTYRFIKRQGQSGCKDYYIETDRVDGFPTRKHVLHVSCNGKVSKMETDLKAFLHLMWSMGLVEDINGFYKPVEEKVKLAYEAEITEIQPRDIQKEEGWVWNGCRPNPPANFYNVVRVEQEEGEKEE